MPICLSDCTHLFEEEVSEDVLDPLLVIGRQPLALRAEVVEQLGECDGEAPDQELQRAHLLLVDQRIAKDLLDRRQDLHGQRKHKPTIIKLRRQTKNGIRDPGESNYAKKKKKKKKNRKHEPHLPSEYLNVRGDELWPLLERALEWQWREASLPVHILEAHERDKDLSGRNANLFRRKSIRALHNKNKQNNKQTAKQTNKLTN
jgi:hypothetical protein